MALTASSGITFLTSARLTTEQSTDSQLARTGQRQEKPKKKRKVGVCMMVMLTSLIWRKMWQTMYVSASQYQNKNKFYKVFVTTLLLILDNRASLISGSMHITLLSINKKTRQLQHRDQGDMVYSLETKISFQS